MSALSKSSVSWLLPALSTLSNDEIDAIVGAIPEKGTCVRKIEGKREVWRVKVGGETFYLKRSRYGSASRLLAGLKFKGLAREFETAKELEKRGVAVPSVVAFGREKGAFPKEDYLITGEVKHARTLRDFIVEDFIGLSGKKKKTLVRAFARFIRNLHDSGVLHADPHRGNILIACEDGKNRFYLLDLAEVTLRQSVGLKERWSNLALLNINFLKDTEDTLRYYFFKHYAKGLIEGRGQERKIIKRIEEQSLRLASRVWKKKAGRCMGENRLFRTFSYGGLKVHIKRKWDNVPGIETMLRYPDDLLDGPGARVLKDGRTVKGGMVEVEGRGDGGEEGEGGRLFLKRYNRKGLTHTIKNIFRTSRASRVWKTFYGLELRGMKAPGPVAYMEERKLRVLRRSYVVCEFISGCVKLHEFIENRWGDMAGAEKKDLISALAREIGRMHRFGWFHGDLKWSNILVKENGEGKINFYFLDIDGSKLKRSLSRSETMKDIVRFTREMERYGTGSEAMRVFLTSYLRQNRTGIAYGDITKALEGSGGRGARGGEGGEG